MSFSVVLCQEPQESQPPRRQETLTGQSSWGSWRQDSAPSARCIESQQGSHYEPGREREQSSGRAALEPCPAITLGCAGHNSPAERGD